jgi:hypothetical protein
MTIIAIIIAVVVVVVVANHGDTATTEVKEDSFKEFFLRNEKGVPFYARASISLRQEGMVFSDGVLVKNEYFSLDGTAYVAVSVNGGEDHFFSVSEGRALRESSPEEMENAKFSDARYSELAGKVNTTCLTWVEKKLVLKSFFGKRGMEVPDVSIL